MLKFSPILVALLACSSLKTYAIVNTESALKSFNHIGFNGQFNLELQGSSGNTKSSELAIDTALGWNTNNSKSILLFGRQFGESNNIKDADNSFVYFKHLQSLELLPENYQISLFAQNEKDDFRDILSRRVFGLGIRSQLNKLNLVELSVMQETIKSTVETEADRDNTRLNLMWHFSYQLNQQVAFRNTAYYQPNIEDFSDKQATNQASLVIDINKNLKVDLYHKLIHFSAPIGNSKSTDTNYGTRFKYQF